VVALEKALEAERARVASLEAALATVDVSASVEVPQTESIEILPALAVAVETGTAGATPSVEPAAVALPRASVVLAANKRGLSTKTQQTLVAVTANVRSLQKDHHLLCQSVGEDLGNLASEVVVAFAAAKKLAKASHDSQQAFAEMRAKYRSEVQHRKLLFNRVRLLLFLRCFSPQTACFFR
jgi:hypothetical protein